MKKSPEFSRTRRVGELIQRDLAELIRRELHDPKLGMITISAVDVSTDLRHAKVYFTVIGQQYDLREVSKTLNQVASELRYHLARRMTTRVTPELHFYHDSSIEYGNNLAALIESANPHKEP